jgi:hypothetical protein
MIQSTIFYQDGSRGRWGKWAVMIQNFRIFSFSTDIFVLLTVKHSSAIKSEAIILRMKGHSLGEISKLLSVPRGTIRSWVFAVDLSETAKKRIEGLRIAAREKGQRVLLEKRRNKALKIQEKVSNDLLKIDFSQANCRLLCSFLFWAEGGKKENNVSFVNSDPQMIEIFVLFLRKGWNIDESKFRCLIHFHQYHSEGALKKFWSSVTKIPIDQFTKSYLKKNTGINKKEGYKGCLHIRYYNSQIAQELTTLYNTASQVLRGVG